MRSKALKGVAVLGLIGGFVFAASANTLYGKSENLDVFPQRYGMEKPLLEFKDVKKETQRFIEYFYTINLSPSEQKILERALKPLPAPCCADNSALTC